MIKRAFDFVLALCGLTILSPLFLLLALVIKLSDFGPVLFVQERVGRFGRGFAMFKFRTMVVNAESLGGQLTANGDRRITWMGGLLRKSKADELPQLWNVVRGEMSFVGPRPEVRRYVDMYTAEQAKVLDLTPGITDLASFAFFDEGELLRKSPDPESFYKKVLVPEKIRINLEYGRRANLLFDLVLICCTVLRSFGLRPDLFAWFHVRAPNVGLETSLE